MSVQRHCTPKGNLEINLHVNQTKLTIALSRINYDPSNSQLYTNRANSLLSLTRNSASKSTSANLPLSPIHVENYEQVILDCHTSIRLVAENMKAYYFLAQAQIALHHSAAAVLSAKEAHRLCVEEVHTGGKGASSIGPITELVLRCKKEDWEARETERLQRQKGLASELESLLQKERKAKAKELDDMAKMGLLNGERLEAEMMKLEDEFQRKADDVRKMAVAAGIVGEEAKKRVVPDWCVDDITFSVMVDPVVVSSGLCFRICFCSLHILIIFCYRQGQGSHMTAVPSWNILNEARQIH